MTATDTARAGWLAWRREGIGASDVAAILGISPWASPWSVWADKLGLLPEQAEDEYMAAGRWLERAIGPWFEHETGLTVAGEQTWCTHREHAHHRCTVDGFVFEGPAPVFPNEVRVLDNALGCFEVKVTGPGRRWEELPAHYQAQGQWQMHVTDLERVWFAVLMGRRLDIHELERDQADIDLMVERVDDFWHDHVVTAVPPDTDGSDATAHALAAVYPEHTPGTSVAFDDYGNVLINWVAAKRRKRDAETDEKEATNAIRAYLGAAEEGTVGGQRIVTLRSQTRTTTCKHCGATDTSEPFRVLRQTTPKEQKP